VTLLLSYLYFCFICAEVFKHSTTVLDTSNSAVEEAHRACVICGTLGFMGHQLLQSMYTHEERMVFGSTEYHSQQLKSGETADVQHVKKLDSTELTLF